MSAKKSTPSKAGSPSRPAPGRVRGLHERGAPDLPHDSPGSFWTTWGLWVGLVIVTLIAYYPAWHGAPVWDDDAHLTRVDLRSLTGLWRIWFDVGATQQYYPVAHSAFWLFHALWGDDTLGYHLVNIVLHATSAYLVAVILRRLAIPGAALAALIFALHPVHVESVAWITELKNTLSGVCYLGAVLTYLRFDSTRERRWYVVTLALFVLALLSKSVTASLPAALLVVFWWQRGRVRWKEDVRPLLPLFGVGLASGLFTAWVERSQIGADGPQFQFSLIERTLIAGRAVWFYLGKLVWPDPLIFSYSRWHVSQAVWWQYLFPIALAALFGGLWLIRNRTRAPLAAMLCFAGTLFPALGFVNVYPFIYSFVADHFQYLASLGVITLFAAGVATLAARRVARPDTALAAVALVVGLPAAVLTWQQSGKYRDAETLYRTTLSLNPESWMAHINLGKIRQEAAHAHGDDPALLTEAMQEFREAIRIEPSVSQAHNNLGTVLLALGQYDAAATEYREALRLRPGDAQVQYNLGLVLQRQGRPDEAIATIESSLATRPNDPSAHLALGDALQSAGRFDEAISVDNMGHEHILEPVECTAILLVPGRYV